MGRSKLAAVPTRGEMDFLEELYAIVASVKQSVSCVERVLGEFLEDCGCEVETVTTWTTPPRPVLRLVPRDD
jgi:hypothetical protein